MKDSSQWRWNEHYKRSNQANCGDKRTFNSFAEASAFNKRSSRFLRGSLRREKLHVYKCNSCKQWHIGHYPSDKENYHG